MYERALQSKVRATPRSLLLLGPRQVGKSTLLNALAPDRTIDLAGAQSFRDYLTDPARLERELAAADAATRTILIDEVQRVPALLDVVQSSIDQRPGRFRFLLSGSSARKLRRGQANLLPGRIHMHQLHPLLAREIGADFELDRVLAHGTLPGIYRERDPALRANDLRSYTETYLREEIQAEALVRNLGGYARLLDLVAASSGRILNANSLAQETRIGYETVRRYLEVMEDTLVLTRIPAWSESDRASLVAHPKLYLFDLGVRNALLRRPLDRPLDDERGLLLEHLVALELCRRRGSLWPELEVHHLRTRHGMEVDFIVTAGRERWAIEVKSSRHVDKPELRGVRRCADHVKGLTRRIVVFTGDQPQRVDDVEILPLARFLDELPT